MSDDVVLHMVDAIAGGIDIQQIFKQECHPLPRLGA